MSSNRLNIINNTASWRSGPSSTSTSPQTSPRSVPSWRSGRPPSAPAAFRYDELRLGGVYMLPAYQDVPANSPMMQHPSWNQDAGSHPCILIGKSPNGTIEVLPCTSFGGQGIKKYREECRRQRAWYWLIEHDNEVAHDDTPLLKLTPGSKGFIKATYVKVGAKDIYTLDANLLQSWNTKDLITLDAASLSMIKVKAGMPMIPPVTPMVPTTIVRAPPSKNLAGNWRSLAPRVKT